MPDLYRDADWRTNAGFTERITDLLPRIPPIERDVVHLYFVVGKKQEVIARILKLSQQAISHRLHSAYRRIIFMLAQPDIQLAQMEQDLSALLPNEFTVKVLCDFAQTSSQTMTAKRLGVPQQRICWHLNSGLRLLRDSLSVDAAFYAHYFLNLRRNRNILREVIAGVRRKRAHSGEETKYARFERGPARSYATHAVAAHEHRAVGG